MKRNFIKISGIVQGVGFRPYVYKIAVKNNLKGWVNNTSEGVFVDVEGTDENISNLVTLLQSSPPPLAKITDIQIEELAITGFKDFTIKTSEDNKNKVTLISPDISTCEDCFNDISDPMNKRYEYPFTNCTNCGPRFTIIKNIPYDRCETTMSKFPMCTECTEEYENPLDRRFHAQPNACDECGPKLWIESSKGERIECDNPLEFTRKELLKGKILAIKGLGGFHLCCNAYDKEALQTLRLRKNRPFKPFAIMVDNPEVLKRGYIINTAEEELIRSKERPIVIIEKKRGAELFPLELAPNVNTCGVMMPYTPLHKLLFKGDITALVMTSANITSLPLEYTNEGARENLSSIADYFLFHNRDIHTPIDDSIVRIVGDRTQTLRRARGYVPLPLKHVKMNSILALGPNMKNTFSFSKEDNIFMSQYNGDLESYDNIILYKKNLEHFSRIYDFQPEVVVYDNHPAYFTTTYSNEFKAKKLSVQHHYAHILSCMTENSLLHKKVIGIAFDGTGYGDDGKVWGGEFFICDVNEYKRYAHFEYMDIQGGESAIKNPWKIAVAYLNQAFKKSCSNLTENEFENVLSSITDKEIDTNTIITLLNKKINTFTTSSLGRLFDCISSLISVCDKSTYEGQASIELQELLWNLNIKSDDSYEHVINENDGLKIIGVSELICDISKDILNYVPKEIISLKFHNTIVNIIVDICLSIRDEININDICLSGGVFQNSYILESCIQKLTPLSFNVYTHKDYPCNDGGISLGQLIYAWHQIKEL
ncbi:carbamoyltransferase HypF [Oceanirhabdus sp. W0125-5]|uniref:carbamoyltransferase HypF n=1 Tax=Oceanirhabdus sp. W0125-5 TaxID=2999116 RepID=UPI0022F2AF60|nr:carbamoyltransferase HypF [Oceanirhabdus sp. W0125-5]WBW96138.1 carbamoyltransferase HypF [Oceanirhabdus sp. W0125-5]